MINKELLPPIPEDFQIATKEELSFSDNYTNFKYFRQLIRDGIPLYVAIEIKENVPPSFEISIDRNRFNSRFTIWLIPQIESFLLVYLLTGKSTGLPSYPQNGVVINYIPDVNYIYRHIKREIERNTIITYKEVNSEGISGIRVIADYPYGSIDYGFLPHNIEKLNNILEQVESYKYIIDEYDIPELQTTDLTIELLGIEPNARLGTVFNEIPTNCILDKTICGIGATWLEIHSERNSIIIEPNVPVIVGKVKEHPKIIGIYGDDITSNEIAKRIATQTGYIKIMTTPDSYPKIVTAFRKLRIPFKQDYFLLFDECEKAVTDVAFRSKIVLPIDDFFQFANKAMVSATPIVIDDPRFSEQNFKIIKIKPNYDYKRPIELIPTNNVRLMLKRTLLNLPESSTVFIFFNSISGVKDIMEYLHIENDSALYCSTKSKKELKKEGYTENIYDNLLYNADAKLVFDKRYCFLTSKFYSAVDIKLDYKPIVIMITDVYKTYGNEIPYTIIDPETEAIQIAGRFRNGIERLIHITNTNENISFMDKLSLEKFLISQHSGYLKLQSLSKEVKEEGEKYIINQAINNTDYVKYGYVTSKGEINYFRYNNAYIDERLKMLYCYPARLYKAYDRSGIFNIFSESEYCIYTERELQKIRSTNTRKSERINLLFQIFNKIMQSGQYYDKQFLNDIQNEFPLYIEAFKTIGFRRVKQLDFVDSDIKDEIRNYNFIITATTDEVKLAVYKIFEENTTYPISFIRTHLKQIFKKHNVILHRQPQGKDISFYFECEPDRGTGGIRVWKLGSKR